MAVQADRVGIGDAHSTSFCAPVEQQSLVVAEEVGLGIQVDQPELQ